MLVPVLPMVRNVEVYAAVSLREAFTTVAQAFERAHPGAKVRLNFAGSQTLAAQIAHGAPADVFASASANNLRGLAYDPKTRHVFATNRLVVLGAPSLHALAKAPRIVLAAKAVPAGGYAEQAISAAAKVYGAAWATAVRSHVVSEENDVRAVLAKVRLREADAGIVYASDAKGALVPKAFQPRIEYPVVLLTKNPLAKEFVSLLLGPTGRRALSARGFGAP